ncbi:probable E3 ubiquitin-protein ligase BAH1-like isoform X2 [Capsicum annuum]|uniref:probable E3 ubiquitin-protein ligase BAH1-like isoform X2 n=1 Tax=Capsicum annuum TaxID=4072 RepID=UPI001FB0F145|nr:probable E3 ubiquitin-protein ligase BAH1-like isoform X2 [Capsicum annuum]
MSWWIILGVRFNQLLFSKWTLKQLLFSKWTSKMLVRGIKESFWDKVTGRRRGNRCRMIANIYLMMTNGKPSSRVRRLLQLHSAPGIQRYLVTLCQCFKNDQLAMMQKCQILIEYAMMNVIAMQKILKKYDKVHCSVNGRNFKSKMRAEHLEILQSPWLIKLGALYLNFNESNGGTSTEIFSQFSCNLSDTGSIMTLIFPDSVKLEYDLTCPICLDTVFNPYALGCGHPFCKSCACTAASVMIFQGIKAASDVSKCPVCREVGTYANAVNMMELDLLQKKRFKQYWKERHASE